MDRYLKLIFDNRGRRVKKVMDVGCGNGRQALLAAGFGAKVLAIDCKPKPRALRNSKLVRYVQTDFEKWTIPDGRWNLLILRCVIQFLDKKFILKKFLPRFCSNNLSGGGVVYIATFGNKDPFFAKAKSRYTVNELKTACLGTKLLLQEEREFRESHQPIGWHCHHMLYLVLQKIKS